MALLHFCKYDGCKHICKTRDSLIAHIQQFHDTAIVYDVISIAGRCDDITDDPTVPLSPISPILGSLNTDGSELNTQAKNLQMRLAELSRNLLSAATRLETLTEPKKASLPQTLPSSPATTPRNQSEINTCCICLVNSRDTVVVPCGHYSFCGKCLQQHITENPNTGCPRCLGPISSTCRVYD